MGSDTASHGGGGGGGGGGSKGSIGSTPRPPVPASGGKSSGSAEGRAAGVPPPSSVVREPQPQGDDPARATTAACSSARAEVRLLGDGKSPSWHDAADASSSRDASYRQLNEFDRAQSRRKRSAFSYPRGVKSRAPRQSPSSKSRACGAGQFLCQPRTATSQKCRSLADSGQRRGRL